MSQRNGALLLFSLVAVAFAVGGWWYQRAVTTRIAHLADLRAESRMIRQQLEPASLVQANEALRAEIDAEVGHNVVDVLDDLTHRLNCLDVKNVSITNRVGATAGPFRRVPLEVAFTGSFEDVFKLTNKLRQDDRALCLRRMEIERQPMAASNKLAVSMTFETYVADAGGVK